MLNNKDINGQEMGRIKTKVKGIRSHVAIKTEETTSTRLYFLNPNHRAAQLVPPVLRPYQTSIRPLFLRDGPKRPPFLPRPYAFAPITDHPHS